MMVSLLLHPLWGAALYDFYFPEIVLRKPARQILRSIAPT